MRQASTEAIDTNTPAIADDTSARSRQLRRYWQLKAQVDALSASYRTFGDQLEPLRAERVRLEQGLNHDIPRDMQFMPRDEIERVRQPRLARLQEVTDEIAFLTAERAKLSQDHQTLGQLVSRLRSHLKIGNQSVLSIGGE